jgi:hypothetical protein
MLLSLSGWAAGNVTKLAPRVAPKLLRSQITMDLFAGTFALLLVVISLFVTYHWGIRPDREARRRRESRLLAEQRRQRELGRRS